MKLQPRMQDLVMSRLGWQLNYLFWLLILHVAGNQCQLWVGQELENPVWKLFSDAAIRPWAMHVHYNPDGVVKYSVIHRLQLINSAQLCNKKFQSICWSRNALCLGTYHFLWEGGVWRFYGGATFFSEPKKGGSHFFPEFNIKYFFKKRYAISETRVQAVLLSHCLFLFQIRTCRYFV